MIYATLTLLRYKEKGNETKFHAFIFELCTLNPIFA